MKDRVRRPANGSRVREAGAVAVEFALVVPLLFALVLGIAEFGRAFNIQISLSEAARQASRYAAINCKAPYNSACDAAAIAAGKNAAPSVSLVSGDFTVTYSSGAVCSTAGNANVTINYMTPWMTGFPSLVPGMPTALTVKSVGVMRCGG